MAATVFSAGSHSSGTSSITRTWPTGYVIGDVAILFCCRQQATGFATPSGWTLIVDTGITTSGTTGLQLWWRRAATLSEDTNFPATVAGSGDKLVRMTTFRNCVSSGDPIHGPVGSLKSPATTALSIAGITTTVDDLLMCYYMTQEFDATTDPFISNYAVTNANLTQLRVQNAQMGVQGSGMGTGCITGVLKAQGASGTLTGTLVQSTNWAACVLGIVGDGRNRSGQMLLSTL